tara:strand:+ start:153 stop:2063 length:1911 start_codon:yes stop_codon:yes gene_type:complete
VCGIAGIIGNRAVNVFAVKAMLEKLVHRGPDGEGLWSSLNRRVVLGHRRLAVIDPTPAGSQPMISDDGKTVITFNGEIYNFIELAERLKSEGYIFKSRTDTEVLLAVYRKWGIPGFSELNGMFAFAIYDEMCSTLICARDRFGEKPLLFSHGDHFFSFASEYKALLCLDSVSSEVDVMRLASFMNQPRWGLDNTQESIFGGVKQLLAGEVLQLNINSLEWSISRYWNLTPDLNAQKLTDLAAAEAFGELLADSVAIRMRSDVEVGSCLSGGLDSSSIVCLNRRHLSQDSPYHVFTGRFENDGGDDWLYARQVIDFTQVVSHETTPTPDGLASELPLFVWHNELPVGSSSQYAQWCVFRLAKNHGVTVLLDGQGADEILGGYEQYFQSYLRSLVQRGDAIRALAEEPKIRKRYPMALEDTATIWKKRLPFGLRRSLAHALNKGSDFRFGLSGDVVKIMNSRSLTDEKNTLMEALWEDSFNAHLPTLLRYGDRNAMAHSREVRLPFCDHRLAEFAFAQPVERLMGDAETKRLLRRSMIRTLPEGIASRWNKQGFLPPQESWFSGALGIIAEDIIESEAFRSRGIWDPSWWKYVLTRLKRGEEHLAWALWKPVIAESWYRHFVDEINAATRHPIFVETC